MYKETELEANLLFQCCLNTSRFSFGIWLLFLCSPLTCQMSGCSLPLTNFFISVLLSHNLKFHLVFLLCFPSLSFLAFLGCFMCVPSLAMPFLWRHTVHRSSSPFQVSVPAPQPVGGFVWDFLGKWVSYKVIFLLVHCCFLLTGCSFCWGFAVVVGVQVTACACELIAFYQCTQTLARINYQHDFMIFFLPLFHSSLSMNLSAGTTMHSYVWEFGALQYLIFFTSYKLKPAMLR